MALRRAETRSDRASAGHWLGSIGRWPVLRPQWLALNDARKRFDRALAWRSRLPRPPPRNAPRLCARDRDWPSAPPGSSRTVGDQLGPAAVVGRSRATLSLPKAGPP